ncbi:transposase [Mycobacterium sp. E802]|uniref:helix-turn-helix domain-containing protein n=1 Tax=Mycobacterium sp. E802 TaxID=1834152 RepID=UPI0007FC6054|nr:helix-turn-helix domain-containing protein [Mycobacterium sp. E802]OBG81429.1 transposase [Mycobacterium sp. E802]
MGNASIPVRIGTKFWYLGERLRIVGMQSRGMDLNVLAVSHDGQTVIALSVEEVLLSERAQLIAEDEGPAPRDEADVASVVLWAAPEGARRDALEHAAHIREVRTGYRSGSAEAALAGEPRWPYAPGTPKMMRYRAKAAELGVHPRTFQRWVAAYEADGEAGLISQRSVQSGTGSRTDPRWEETALEVMAEYADMSTPTKDLVIRRTNARLDMRYGPGVVKLPSQRTAYYILDRLEHEKLPTFEHSAKRNRDIASRPTESYGGLHPTRPGEYMLMDTTPLDVYAMDPNTLQWVNAQLTVVMDWFTGCVTGLRLTPVSTKSIDAAAALYQTFRPPPAGKDWPAKAVWPPHGVPRSVLVEHERLDPKSVIAAATPAIAPETLIVDHGKIFVGAHLNSVCKRFGISIQPARLATGRDKGPVERFFRTLRQALLVGLPGYKGPDLYSRGLDPEKETWFFLDELEAVIREWIAVIYHHKGSDGLGGLDLAGLQKSPAEQFAAGVARGGYLELPRDPQLAFEFLPVVKRVIHPYGIEWNNRIYRGNVIGGRGGERSLYLAKGAQWPIHVNPDDITKVYFRDPRSRDWHELRWQHAELLDAPMSEEQLAFERQLAKAGNRYIDDPMAIAQMMERRKLHLGATMAERRMALRISREQSTLIGDIEAVRAATELASVRAALLRATGQDAPERNELDEQTPDESAVNTFVDDLDEEPDTRVLVDDDYYSDTLEIV